MSHQSDNDSDSDHNGSVVDMSMRFTPAEQDAQDEGAGYDESLKCSPNLPRSQNSLVSVYANQHAREQIIPIFSPSSLLDSQEAIYQRQTPAAQKGLVSAVPSDTLTKVMLSYI